MHARGGRSRRGTIARAGAVVTLAFALANCSASNKFARKIDPKYGVAASPRVVAPGQPVPKGGGVYRVGRPYRIAGRIYVPREDRNYRAEGIASWYGHDFHGRLTANGEVFDMDGISAAHPTLPMPSYVRITNLENGRSIIARVNDRGPYHGDRVIDVSVKTAKLLGFHSNGLGRVRVEYVGPASLAGSDDRKLAATLRHGGEPAPAPVQVASAQGYVPLARSAPPRGPVPVPAGRPYSLGMDDPALVAAGPSTELTAVSRHPVQRADLPVQRAELPDPGHRDAAHAYRPAVERVDAYAPRRADPIAAFMQGRGLY